MKLHVLALLFLAAIFLFACDGDKLRDHGVTTNATITTKSETAGGGRRSHYHTFDIMFFAQDSAQVAKAAHANDVLKDTSMSMADRIDRWQPGGSNIGNITTVTIGVGSEAFAKYSAGQSVSVVYLPEDPNIVQLKEEL